MFDALLPRRDVLEILALMPMAARALPHARRAGLPRVDELARELIAADPDAAFTRLNDLRQAGLSPREALSAIFLAGIQEIRPRPVGFKLHAVMMVASAHEVVQASPAAERWLPVFWNLGDMKRAQARDVQEGDWHLQPRAAETVDDPVAKLAAAVDGDDEEVADRASAAAFASCNVDETFEALWPSAAGDYLNLGHKIIHAAQCRRALDRLGWMHGEPVLRALVYALIAKGDAHTRATWKTTTAAAATLPSGWAGGASEAGAATSLLQRLRPLDAEAAVVAIATASKNGASAATLWDAMRLRACELLLNRPTLLAVHPLTALNAFRNAAMRTAREDTGRALLLQCAAWLGHYRTDLRVGDGDRHLDELAAQATDDPAASVLEVAASDRDAAIARALHHAATAAGRAALADAARAVLVRKAQEHHDYKFAAAVFEEARAAHPNLAPRVLASAFSYLRHAREKDADDVTRALALLGG